MSRQDKGLNNRAEKEKTGRDRTADFSRPLTDGDRMLRLLLSVLFNAGLMFLLFRLFDPVFEGNDDITIVQFVNGSCGSFDPHMVYQNYLLGVVFANLYRLFPDFPWYSWMQFAGLCASFTALTYVLMCRVRRGAGLALSLLVQSFAAYECYINIQYTKTAGVLAAAGMLLIWHGLWGSEKAEEQGYYGKLRGKGQTGSASASVLGITMPGRILTGSVLTGILLAVWSILLRYVQFAACAALTAGIPFLMLLDCVGTGGADTENSGTAGADIENSDTAGTDIENSDTAGTDIEDGDTAGTDTENNGTGNAEDESDRGLRRRGQSTVGLPRMFLRCLAVCAVLGALLVGLVRFDSSMYERDPVWKNYAEYNYARSELMDYGMPKYEDYQDLYTELGISRTAYDLFDTWNSGDTAVFSTEVMKKLAAERPVKKPGPGTARAFLKEVPKGFMKNRIFRCFLVAAGLWVLFGRHDRRAVLSLLFQIILFGALYYYLFLKGRYLYNRVDAGLWMSALFVLLWTFKRDWKRLPAGLVRTGLILGVMAICAFIQIPGWKGRLSSHCEDSRARRREVRQQMKQIAADEDHLYVSKLGILSASRFSAPFVPMPRGILSNVVTLGGWKVESAPYNTVLEKYGFGDNPYEAIAGTSDRSGAVLLLDNDIDATVDYIREYYNPEAAAEEIGEWNGEKIFRIISSPQKELQD